MKDNIHTEYYLSIRARMLREHKAMYRGVRKSLSIFFNEVKIDFLEKQSQIEYENLIPGSTLYRWEQKHGYD